DQTWPLIVEDAARGELKEVYQPERDAKGVDVKPSLQPYPSIPWEKLDLNQFSLVPKMFRPFLSKMGAGWGSFHVVPLETGRGCPYGLDSLPHQRKRGRRNASAQRAGAPTTGTNCGLLY
ncbi:MAG: hypothetical protein ABR568_24480, partial [Pyrinomonadaceae bacterium]